MQKRKHKKLSLCLYALALVLMLALAGPVLVYHDKITSTRPASCACASSYARIASDNQASDS